MNYAPHGLSSLFELAMDRQIPDFESGRPELIKLNIGPGFKKIYDTHELDLPMWNAELDPIPLEDESVGIIYAFGFLDHINNVPQFLRECERVLAPGGVLNISVAHVKSSMAWDDIYHKSYFTEDTWKKTFTPGYWEPPEYKPWQFRIGINLIIGIVERNLCILTQLIKV